MHYRRLFGRTIPAPQLKNPPNAGEYKALEVRPGLEFRQALARLAGALGLTIYDAALSCFVGLVYRHVQQPILSVGAWNSTAAAKSSPDVTCQLQFFTYEFGATSTLVDVAKAADQHSQIPRLTGVASAESVGAIFAMIDDDTATDLLSNSPDTLSFVLKDTGSELIIHVRSGSGSFAFNFMEEFLSQYQLLVKQAVVSPSESILTYSLLTEFGQKIIADPRLPIDKPRYAPPSETFLAYAQRRPNHIAISEKGRNWTYSDVERISGALAKHLCRNGVSPGDVVAVAGPRSFAVVTSILGVLRSGAILLTLDPKLPTERQQVMMHQSRAKWLVDVGRNGNIRTYDARVIHIDDLSGDLLENTEALPSVQLPVLLADAAAYIFFTSGSTGTPKAVLGSHEGLGHFLDWQRRAFDIKSSDRVSQITALSFDAVLRDILLALTSGATLCIPEEISMLDPAAILRWIELERITTLHVVPSLAQAWLIHVPGAITFSKLQNVFFTGEPLTDTLVHRFRELFGDGTKITNFYGPTETTLIKCYHQIENPEPGVQPIGRPLSFTQIVILNQCRQISGINEPGEIAIRTPFRSLGYMNDPDSNARKFVPNPFRNDPQDLIYLTGDRGWYREDGLLAISGRFDSQVKINGMRVEPGEIESLISRYPGIQDAAVAAFDDDKGNKFLVAYLVFKASLSRLNETETVKVREFLATTLPNHMVPAEFVVLLSLPLNANGKINRKALPRPDQAILSTGTMPQSPEYTPSSRRESEIIAIWQRTLRTRRIDVNQSFGALGGDSLSSIDALMGMRHIGIPEEVASTIFEGATIREIAERCSAAGGQRETFALTDAAVVLRALSICLVVAGHLKLTRFEGAGPTGALMIVSGLSFARFQLKSIAYSGTLRGVLKSACRIALPTFLYTLPLQLLLTGPHIASLLFVDNFVDPAYNNGLTFWYVEVLLQNIVILSAVLSFSFARRFAVTRPFDFGMALLVICGMISIIAPFYIWNTHALYDRVPHMTLWYMAVGWCAAYSETIRQKLLAAALLILLCVSVIYTRGSSNWFPLSAGLLLLFVRGIPLPEFAIKAVNALAGASLFIYLTHEQFASLMHKLSPGLLPIVAIIVALVGGIAVWRGWDLAARLVTSWAMQIRQLRPGKEFGSIDETRTDLM